MSDPNASNGAEPSRAPDPAAWVSAHGDVLYRFAMRRLGNPADAEDAVQEALLAGIRSWDGFDHRSSVRTWLVGILRHKVLDALRARRARDARTGVAFQTPAGVSGPGTGGPEVGLGATIESAEERAALRAAIDSLGSPMREAVLLRVVDAYPTEAVCEALGISPEQCWTLVHRGKTRLRDALAQTLGGPYAQGTPPAPAPAKGRGGSLRSRVARRIAGVSGARRPKPGRACHP